MAVPANITDAEFQYSMLKRGAAATRAKLVDAIDYLKFNSVTVPEVMQARQVLERWIGDYNQRINTPGLQDAARAVEGNPTLDILAEYAALKQTADNVITWLDTNQPAEVKYAPNQTKNIRDQFQLFVDGVSVA